MTRGKLILSVLLGGAAYWLFDSATDACLFHEGTFLSLAFSPSPHEIFMRSIIIALFAVTSYIVLMSTRENKMEEDLRKKEKLLSESQRIAHVGSWTWEVATGTITWTDEAYRIYGCSPESFALSPESFLGLVYPDDRAAMQDWIKACLAGNNPADLEFRAVLPDGGVRLLIGRGSLERDAENRPVRMVGTVQDITERKQAETELLRQKTLISTIIESASEAIFAKDAAGKYQAINEAGAGMLGFRAVDVIGRTDRELLPAATADEFRKTDEQVLSSGQAYEREESGVINSTSRIFLAHKTPWRDTSGAIVGVIGISNDITERKQAEESLRESEERYRNLLEVAPVGIAVHSEGKIVFTNPAGRKLLGAESSDQLIGKPIAEIIHPDGFEKARARIQRMMAGEKGLYPAEDVYVRLDGTPVEVEVMASLLAFKGKPAVQVIVTDVTERKKLEAQLRQAQKMEAIGQLAGGVAHDFNNILSAIIGYSHLTELRMQEDDPLRHNIDQILESAQRATVLTQSLLTFSRKQPVKKELLELNAVIGKFEKFLFRLLREDIEMKTNYSSERLTIMADRGQMEQVVMNLVTNARDAMPAKGTLTIETSSMTLDESFVHAHGYGRPGEYVMLSVSDTGIGMSEETRRKIFEPFFTTKEQGKGTGLGLATVYGIVKTHDGFINVYSEPARGTAFHIYIPLVRTGETAAGPVKQAPVRLKGGMETILLAEDDASLRKMTSVVLTHMGYTVIEAENGQEAVEKFTKNKHAVQLVILDGIMPRMNGKEAYQEIIGLVPGVRCIFMSGYAEDVFTKNGILQTKVEFIAKPVTPTVLLSKVRDVLDR